MSASWDSYSWPIRNYTTIAEWLTTDAPVNNIWNRNGQVTQRTTINSVTDDYWNFVWVNDYFPGIDPIDKRKLNENINIL
jgi:hypothetical protein